MPRNAAYFTHTHIFLCIDILPRCDFSSEIDNFSSHRSRKSSGINIVRSVMNERAVFSFTITYLW
jgi:hypothetical protein